MSEQRPPAPASTLAADGNEGSTHHLRLAEFIRANSDPIIAEWEAFASTLKPASDSMSPLQLRNHIRQMLDFLVHDMESRQSSDEERLKSLGVFAKQPKATASELHAALRLAGGFNISQMVSEFRALRASIMRIWNQKKSSENPNPTDIMRFNEAIDQIISETVSYYTNAVGKTQDIFLAIIGHDLRNPIMSIMGCAELLPRIGPLNDRQGMLCHQITESSQRIVAMLDDLVDLTRARLGAGLKIIRHPMDVAFVVHQIAQEMRVSHPAASITVNASGSFIVAGDKARFGQLVSNLLGNAVQYSFTGTTISITLDATSDTDVTLCIHNIGVPIPSEKIPTLFDPLTRGGSLGYSTQRENLGLGLFIANDIVTAHGGTLSVTSTEKDGTTFTATLPRSAPHTTSLPV